MHDTPRTLRRTTTENVLCFLLVLTIAHFCFLWYHICTGLYNILGYCAVDLSSSPVSRTARIVVLSSGTVITPTLGSIVQKGKFAA